MKWNDFEVIIIPPTVDQKVINSIHIITLPKVIKKDLERAAYLMQGRSKVIEGEARGWDRETKEGEGGGRDADQRGAQNALAVTSSLYPVTCRCVTSFHRLTKGASSSACTRLSRGTRDSNFTPNPLYCVASPALGAAGLNLVPISLAPASPTPIDEPINLSRSVATSEEYIL